MKNLQTRTELLLIASGWLWAFALAAIDSPQVAPRMAIAAGLAMALSLLLRRGVMRFFQADLGDLGDRLTSVYLWSIGGFAFGIVLAAYALIAALHGPALPPLTRF